jgi:6-phosphogluconolactonase
MTGRLVLCGLLFVSALLSPAIFPTQAGPEPASVQKEPQAGKLWVFIGTYTRGSKSKGIYRCELDVASGKLSEPVLAVEADNPSFLAIHPTREFLYAVSEVDDFGKKEGAVSAYRLDTKDGSLEHINDLGTGGAAPCHVSIDAKGKVVLVANYTGGSACTFLLFDKGADQGKLRQRITLAQHTGNSVNKARQEAPHAHCIVPDPAGRFALIADLGLDKVFVYKLDGDTGVMAGHTPQFAELSLGAGPRHLAFHPSGKFVYVINELNSTVTAFSYNAAAGSLKALQSITTLPKGFKGESTTAEVVVHPSGKFLYGSNRGHNSIAVFAIDDKTGRLKAAGHQAKNIKTPRNFAVDPSGAFLLVANQDADNIIVFRVDAKTGALSETGVTVSVPRPVCVRMVARGS